MSFIITPAYDLDVDFPDGLDVGALLKQINDCTDIIVHCESVSEDDGDVVLTFSGPGPLSAAELEALDGTLTGVRPSPAEGVIGSHDGQPLAETQHFELDPVQHERTSEGMLLVSPLKSFEQPSLAFVSVDYAKKTTWWVDSERVTDETAVDSGDGLTWDLVGENLVNIYQLTDGEMANHFYTPTSYKVVVKRDGVDISSSQYGYEGGSVAAGKNYPYQVNYVTGQVIFDASQAGHTILVSYSKGLYGKFRLVAPTGYKLCLEHVELQFTIDHGAWTSPMEFVSIIGANEYVVGTYRGMRDILNKFNPGNVVPATGEFTKDLYQIPYNYPSGYTIVPPGTPITKLNTMHGLELRMKYPTIPLDPAKTEMSTATFYCFKKAL